MCSRDRALVRALSGTGAASNKALLEGGATPLLSAAQKGHEAVVRALIELGADVSKAENNGVTPLSVAAQEGHTAIVQILRDAVLVKMRHLSL